MSWARMTTSRSLPEIRIQSYNPYESIYPGKKVISRDTLLLIKHLRGQGYQVVIEPNDGTKLHYAVEKGFGEILSSPILVTIAGISKDIIIGLISAWLYDRLKRRDQPNDVELVLEFEEEGKKVRYSQRGQPISDKRFKTILSALQSRRRKFEKSTRLQRPNPEYFLPIYLEHTGNVVGWSVKLPFSIPVISRQIQAC